MTPWVSVPGACVLLMAKPHAMRANAVRHYQRVVTHSVGPRRAAPNGSHGEPKNAPREAEEPGFSRAPRTVNLLCGFGLREPTIHVMCSDSVVMNPDSPALRSTNRR